MAEEIGSAYLTVKPKMSDGFEKDIESGGKQAGTSFGGAFQVAAGNLIANAVQAIGGTAVDTFKTAFNNYADYEQLIGGVDTLFKESSQLVQKNAAEAFKTTGMSANEYMENVTSFSASLLQGLGGDTEKAAAYADMAMRDMSDNANKMGSDMSSITNAYQGFAKQNYTMLDNLKLGYGGTKEEMQRLLDDAGKIAGVEFDISNYSDVIQAIHVMQEQMGIAGTTAEEAEGTISGSIAMLGSAWQNFLTGVFDENSDMGALGENLFTSLGAVISNIAPRILVLIQNLILGFPEAITTTLQAIPEMLAPAILEIFGTQLGGEINSALGGGVGELVVTLQELGESAKSVFEEILTTAQPILSAIVAVVQAAMPLVSQAIQLVVQFITRSVIPTVNSTIEVIRPVVEQISETIRAYMPEIQNIISGAMDAIQQIIETVWPIVSQVIITSAGAISSIVQEVWPFIEGAIDTATKAIQTVTEDIWPTVSGAVETAAGAIKTAIEGIETVVETVKTIFNDIKGFIEDPLGTAQGFVEDFADTIEGIMGGLNLSLPDIALPHFNVWGGEFPYGIGGYGYPPEFSVEWYGKGGFADAPTLTGYGERGLEFYWPAYSPYFERYAQGIAEHMPMNGVDIHDCTFNVRKDSDIRAVAVELNTLINRQTNGAIR